MAEQNAAALIAWTYLLLGVPCPTCHAEAGNACWVVAGSTVRAVDTHLSRRRAAHAKARHESAGTEHQEG